MRVAFRADSSVEMGTGHIFRCLTLANVLEAEGADITFVCRDLPGNLIDMLHRRGYGVEVLPAPLAPANATDEMLPRHAAWAGVSWSIDQSQTAARLSANEPVDWLVVDHYAFDWRWEEGARRWAKRILVIDDLADRRHAADILLDQTLGHSGADYKGLIPATCRGLYGTRFVLLRPEFAAARAMAIESRRLRRGVRKILVTAGGTDPGNLTAKIIAALAPLNVQLQLDVVLGPNAPHLAAVQAQVAGLGGHIQVSVGVDDMALRMSNADLAIGAAGTTSWERCCVGLPALLVTTAANQAGIAQALEQVGAARLLGDQHHVDVDTIRAAVTALCDDPQALRAMSDAAAAVCDGEGAARVAREMLS